MQDIGKPSYGMGNVSRRAARLIYMHFLECTTCLRCSCQQLWRYMCGPLRLLARWEPTKCHKCKIDICRTWCMEHALQPFCLLVSLPGPLTVHCVLSPLQAYDRLVVPDKLVKSGPYAWCQHPIYTSYMLLFSGFMLWFGSEDCFVLLLYVCWRYYKGRIETEARLLEQAFGNEYIAYKEHTGSFLPRFF